MSLFIRAFFGYQSQTARYPKDVSIYRKGGAVACEQQRAGYGLRPHAFEAGEEAGGVFQRGRVKKRKVQRAEPRVNLAEQVLYPDRFLAREPPGPYGRLDRSDSGAPRLLPGRKAALEAFKSAAAVHVRRRLRKYGLD